jgi:hypothetical protein
MIRRIGIRLNPATLAVALLAVPTASHGQTPDVPWDVQRVSREALVQALAVERDKGYDITASTNAGFMWANVLFRLAAEASASHPEGAPLFIHEADYYHGFLTVAGLKESEAPEFIRISHEYGQHTLVEYRLDRVVDVERTETLPASALAVRTWWPEDNGMGDRYAYEDTLSSPRLQVENDREVTYRLLQLDDQIVFDEMDGIRGRPTSGVLGALFGLLGSSRLLWSRMARADDGTILSRAEGKKLVSKTALADVEPDGTGGELPEDRADLRSLVRVLESPVNVAYRDWPL